MALYFAPVWLLSGGRGQVDRPWTISRQTWTPRHRFTRRRGLAVFRDREEPGPVASMLSAHNRVSCMGLGLWLVRRFLQGLPVGLRASYGQGASVPGRQTHERRPVLPITPVLYVSYICCWRLYLTSTSCDHRLQQSRLLPWLAPAL